MENIRVAVRIKPVAENAEPAEDATFKWEQQNNQLQRVDLKGKPDGAPFCFGEFENGGARVCRKQLIV